MDSGFPDLWDSRDFARALDAAFNAVVTTWGETLVSLYPN